MSLIKIFNKKKINLSILKKILLEKGFTVKKKKDFFYFHDLKSLYYTGVFSIFVILFSIFLPLSLNFKEIADLLKKKHFSQATKNEVKIHISPNLPEHILTEKVTKMSNMGVLLSHIKWYICEIYFSNSQKSEKLTCRKNPYRKIDLNVYILKDLGHVEMLWILWIVI